MSVYSDEEKEMESAEAAAAAAGHGPATRSAARRTQQYEFPNELRIKWTDAAIARLGDAIRPYVFIYDFAHHQHNDRDLKREAWMTIAKNVAVINDPRLLPLFAAECERKYKNLRDEYVKTLKKKKKNARPYRHAPSLSFLDNYVNIPARPSAAYYDETTGQLVDHAYDGANDEDDNNNEDASAAAALADHHHHRGGGETSAGGYAAAQLSENGMLTLTYPAPPGGDDDQHQNDGQITLNDVIAYAVDPGSKSSNTGSGKRKSHSKKGSGSKLHHAVGTPSSSSYQPYPTMAPPSNYYQHHQQHGRGHGFREYVASPSRFERNSASRFERDKNDDECEDFSNMLSKRLRRLPADSWGGVMSRLMETLSKAEETCKKQASKTVSCQTDHNSRTD